MLFMYYCDYLGLMIVNRNGFIILGGFCWFLGCSLKFFYYDCKLCLFGGDEVVGFWMVGGGLVWLVVDVVDVMVMMLWLDLRR